MLDLNSNLIQSQLNRFILSALEEDIGAGDISAKACLDTQKDSQAELLLKEDGVIAGIELARLIFQMHDERIHFNPFVEDGQNLAAGTVLFKIKGPESSILSAERVVLNCLQRMSGIATLTAEVQNKISHTGCKVLDTRKTTPNFRIAEKWAVQIGGGTNHRMGLYDMVMLKDNHIDYCGSIHVAIQKTLAYLKNNNIKVPIVVETRNRNEVQACLNYSDDIDRILLDNMSVNDLKVAVDLIANQIQTEASGGINTGNVLKIAETGVNFISMGSIIYNAKVLDMSLKAIS
ncbi:MAG: nicotinate-nucleotide diphosphorylase (carboxylating) [Flavobacteriaceae bacterium]|nr:nicotinate-nucleotide diphosphorylase (carboxylating) [Flavobacteriaceae bacterium]